MKKDNVADAEHLKKGAEIKTRFWTNKIFEDKARARTEREIPAWFRRIAANGPYDVKTKESLPFAMTVDASAVIGRALVKRGIVLPSGRDAEKYLDQKLKRPPGREDTFHYDA